MGLWIKIVFLVFTTFFAFSSACLAEWKESTFITTPSFDPAYKSELAAASIWRDSHTFGYFYYGGDLESKKDNQKEADIDKWGREVFGAFKWSAFTIEIGYTPGRKDEYSYVNNTYYHSIKTDEVFANVAVLLGDSVSFGINYSLQEKEWKYNVDILDQGFNNNEKSKILTSGASFSIKLLSFLYVAGGLLKKDYEFIVPDKNIKLTRDNLLYGIGIRTGNPGEVQFRLEYFRSLLLEKKRTANKIHLPKSDTENYAVEIKFSDYSLSYSQSVLKETFNDFMGDTGITLETRSRPQKYGLIITPLVGVSLGMYASSIDKTTDAKSDLASSKYEITGKGFEFSLGVNF